MVSHVFCMDLGCVWGFTAGVWLCPCVSKVGRVS